MHSPGVLRTGSLFHGVSLNELPLAIHVDPAPASLTVNPPAAFAITLIHGAGGSADPSSLISYSSFSLNPPMPLKKRRPSSSIVEFFSDDIGVRRARGDSITFDVGPIKPAVPDPSHSTMSLALDWRAASAAPSSESDLSTLTDRSAPTSCEILST